MISQRAKDWYWKLSGPLCWLNLQARKVQWRYFANRTGLLLNIGAGEEYVEGLLNIEGNILQKKDLWLNLNHGLPFRNGQVKGIYLSHVLEHFSADRASSILGECRRVLSDGGGIRIVVPSLEQAIDAYRRGDKEWFSSFPDHCESLGGRFSNYMLCRDQHRLLLDHSFLEELARGAGFARISNAGYRKSEIFCDLHLEKLEPSRRREFCERSLIMEALKD